MIKKLAVPLIFLLFFMFLLLPALLPAVLKNYFLGAVATMLILLELYALVGLSETKAKKGQTLVLIVLTAIVIGTQFLI
jgi:hypothetical protein